MKRWIAVVMTVVCLMSLCLPATAALEEAYPVIYLKGVGSYLYQDDGTKVYDLNISIMDRIKANLKDLLRNVAKGVATGNYKDYNDTLYETIAPVYASVKLGTDGLPRDGSHIHPNYMWRGGTRTIENIHKTLPLAGGGQYPVYLMRYDWRLSPILLAEELNDLIETVLAETGAKKVNLVTRCYGTNIAYAYLYLHGTDRVNSVVFYAPALEGVGVAEAMFTGNIVVDASALERFAHYYKDEGMLTIRDEPTTELLFAMLTLFEETKGLDFSIAQLQKIVKAVKHDVIPRILRDSFASYPSYWSMIGAEQYETARKFVFGGVEDEWAGLLAQTDAYYEMQKNMRSFLKTIGEQVHIGVISKYGLPAYPLSEDAGLESDVYATTVRTSLGAQTAEVDKTFSDAKLRQAVKDGTAQYISADCKIDASSALFPETTWFVKDLHHSYFPDCVNNLWVAFVNGNTMTVHSHPAFTQFLQYQSTTDPSNREADEQTGTLTPIRTMADTHDSTVYYHHNFVQTLKQFLRALWTFLKSQFRKG